MLVGSSTFGVALSLGIIGGAAIGAFLMYWALVPRMKLILRDGIDQGKQAALDEISMERIPDLAQEGMLKKKYYLVIRERLLNNKIPISPFWEYKFLIAEKLDRDELAAITSALATIADKILGLADLRAMIFGLIKARPSKTLDRK